MITLSVAEDAGGTCQSQVSFAINTAPTQPTLSLSQVSPDTTMDITAQVGGSTDADGDTVSYLYAWELNGGQTRNNRHLSQCTHHERRFTSPHSDASDGVSGTGRVRRKVTSKPHTKSSAVVGDTSVQSHQLYPNTLTPSNGQLVPSPSTCAATATDPDPLMVMVVSFSHHR